MSAPLVLVQEVGQRIAFSIPVSASAKASFTFRLQRADDSVKDVSFLATDLVTSNGKRIPRQKISIAGASLDANPKDFTIVVDDIDTIGQFAGQLVVRSPQVPTGIQTIDVAVTVSPIAAPTFAVENPKLKLQLAEACGPFTRFVLGGTHCPGTFGLPFSVPTGTQDPKVDLLLVDANNAAIEPENSAGASAVTAKNGKVLVNLSNEALPPGHYSGRVRATFAATGEQIQAPVEIDVRVAAGLPTLLIIAGILVGRLQALMTSSGNAVLAASRRLDRIRVRSNGLWNDARMALSATSGQIADAVSARDIPLATQLLTKQEVCLRALETAQPLVESEPYVGDPAKFSAEMNALLNAVRLGDDAAAATTLAAFVTVVTPAAPLPNQPQIAADAAIVGAVAKPAAKMKRWARDNGLWLRELFVLSVVQKALFLLLVTLLGAAGLGTLYISNGAILGASPLSDYVTLFAWGLTADVASRTLASARA